MLFLSNKILRNGNYCILWHPLLWALSFSEAKLLNKLSAQHCSGSIALIKYNKLQIMNGHNFILLQEINWNIRQRRCKHLRKEIVEGEYSYLQKYEFIALIVIKQWTNSRIPKSFDLFRWVNYCRVFLELFTLLRGIKVSESSKLIILAKKV